MKQYDALLEILNHHDKLLSHPIRPLRLQIVSLVCTLQHQLWHYHSETCKSRKNCLFFLSWKYVNGFLECLLNDNMIQIRRAPTRLILKQCSVQGSHQILRSQWRVAWSFIGTYLRTLSLKFQKARLRKPIGQRQENFNFACSLKVLKYPQKLQTSRHLDTKRQKPKNPWIG